MIRSTCRGFLLAISLSLLTLSTAHADPVAEKEEHCVVRVATSDTLNIRAGPNAQAEVVAQKRHDACGIVVTGPCNGNWCPAEDGHVVGWVHRRYLGMVSPSLYCVTGVAPGDDLNLRAFPSAQSKVLAKLDRNQCDIAFLPYAVGSWQKIRVGGYEGWASRRYLSGQ